jgi:RNA-binding protein YlmH
MERKEETERLFARIDDLYARAERGETAVSVFLSPRELHFACRRLEERRALFLAFGGYEGAERKRLYILPDHMEGIESVSALSEYGENVDISVLKVSGSGFSKLSHRDFMGSLLGLGLERSVIGDIVVTETGREAVVFCDSAITRFLLENWTKAGNDKVRVESISLPENFSPQRRFARINDTVASPRVDGVVAALCSLSRDKARELVENECVEVDYDTVTRPDRTLTAPCLVTVRGYGKFRVVSVSEQTKKGRYRLEAEKYL